MHIEPFELFKILGDKTRLKILELLKTESPIGAKEISEKIGITTAAVSQHLKILKHSGLVTNERKGYFIPYSLDHEAMVHCGTTLNKVCSCGCNHHRHNGNHMFHKNYGDLPLDELLSYKQKLTEFLDEINKKIEKLEKEKD